MSSPLNRDGREGTRMSIQGGTEYKPTPNEGRERFGQQHLEELAYWRQRLSGKLSALDLPLDWPRPAHAKGERGARTFTLPLDARVALKKLAASRGTDLGVVLLATLETLLYRYTAQEDLLVAAELPLGMRPAGTPGSNQVMIRSSISGEATFSSVVEQVRQTVIEAREHASSPFESILTELGREIDPTV